MVADTAGGGEFDRLPRKRLSGKRIVLFIVLPLLLLAGAGAGLYLSGTLDSLLASTRPQEPALDARTGQPVCVPTFHDLPEVLVNLSSTANRRASFMKLKITLELCRPEDAVQVGARHARIVDILQVYLREQRIEDLRGSAGFQRLREELRHRIRMALDGIELKDLLFGEVLVQ